LLRLVVCGPVDRLERRLDLVQCRGVVEVVLGEPGWDLVHVAQSAEYFAQLAPGTVIERPGIRKLDVLGKAPVDEDLGEDGMGGALRNPEVAIDRVDLARNEESGIGA